MCLFGSHLFVVFVSVVGCGCVFTAQAVFSAARPWDLGELSTADGFSNPLVNALNRCSSA